MMSCSRLGVLADDVGGVGHDVLVLGDGDRQVVGRLQRLEGGVHRLGEGEVVVALGATRATFSVAIGLAALAGATPWVRS